MPGFAPSQPSKHHPRKLYQKTNMVLDPFSALGLAGNVIQLVDFGSKLFSQAAELYHSADGALAVNKELELITEDLRKYSVGCKTSSLTCSTILSVAETNLVILTKSCKHVADELLSVLKKLRFQGGQGKWKSVRQAFASAWSEKKIRSYKDRLHDLQSQITSHLVATLRSVSVPLVSDILQ